MNGRGFITISMHELERVKIIEAVVQRRLTILLAAERLQLCERQVSRLVIRYRASGAAGLCSGRRSRPGNAVSRFKNHRRGMPCSSRTVRCKEVLKTRHIFQCVRMPGQRGHSVRFPSARSDSHALARSCATPGVPDINESSRERSISSDNASANTAATYSSTDCPDRCAAVATAASSSSGNATVSITTPKHLTRLYCSRRPAHEQSVTTATALTLRNTAS